MRKKTKSITSGRAHEKRVESVFAGNPVWVMETQKTFTDPMGLTEDASGRQKVHKMDIFLHKAAPSSPRIALSCKYQGMGGTAEEKILFESLRLARLIERDDVDCGYIILGGQGWTKSYIDRYQSELSSMINSCYADHVKVITYEQFLVMEADGTFLNESRREVTVQ